jgi:hypothetical protein
VTPIQKIDMGDHKIEYRIIDVQFLPCAYALESAGYPEDEAATEEVSRVCFSYCSGDGHPLIHTLCWASVL